MSYEQEKGEWERVRAELIRRREAAEKAQEDLEVDDDDDGDDDYADDDNDTEGPHSIDKEKIADRSASAAGIAYFSRLLK